MGGMIKLKLKTTDTELLELNGIEIIKVVELDRSTYDYEDVGAVYDALLANGEHIQVFEDEIID